MTKGSLQIHSENILPIIKKWLYSDRDIFLRELVSNACDASSKLRILREQGECQFNDDELRIDIKINKEAKTLTFSDTGIGMTADEVEKYIAQLAFSGAEEFMEKYKGDDQGNHVIGHFGLGFYSSYMVASSVEINTLSYKEDASPAYWQCDGSSEYDLTEGTRQSRGTEITLHVLEEEAEFLEEQRLKEILKKYCSFLATPIYLNDELINGKDPLWLKNPSECKDEDYIEFYKHLYPFAEEPLFWVHLNVDYPFNLKGILYFPKMKRDMDFNKNHIGLYCNRVFVSEDCKEIIPEYLMVLQGAIDSPDIPLNVSRSYLQMDRTVRQVSTHISKKVCDRLQTLYRNDKEKFLTCWKDIEIIVKLGAIQDEKFYERVKSLLHWKNLSNEWTTVEEYLENHKDKTDNVIYYTNDERADSHLLEAYKEKGIEVLQTNPLIDTHLIQFLEGKLAPVTFRRTDSLHDSLTDSSREKNILDSEGKTVATKIAEFFEKKLDSKGVKVEAKSLHSDDLAAVLSTDEQGRRMREFMQHANPEMTPEQLGALGGQTFVVNTNNPMVEAIQKLNAKNPELSSEMTEMLFDLTRLSQREMNPEGLHTFVKRTSSLMERLATQALEQEAK